jgi:hypothetical protein
MADTDGKSRVDRAATAPGDGSRACATLLFRARRGPAALAASALVLQSSLSPPVIPYFHYKAHTPGHRTPAHRVRPSRASR